MVRTPQPIASLLKPIESREILSWDSCAPRKSIVLTWRNTTDWWWWENSSPLALDAKQTGEPSATSHSSAADGFHVRSWGHQFSVLKGLKTFELELETVEGKRKELDEIVIRAGSYLHSLLYLCSSQSGAPKHCPETPVLALKS